MTTFPNPIYEEVYSEPYQVCIVILKRTSTSGRGWTRSRNFLVISFISGRRSSDGQFGEVHIGEVDGLADILGEDFKHTPRMTVAIKTLKLDVDKNIKDDFFKEVKAMAGLRHSNVFGC
ncbi:DNA damage responsive protein [Desmophyllum pertusum]|uniref:DNA damage responsive protein n=1 Tax=Desmophyllum pertusum TaxID=174260 RepID=A0A9W9YDC6_9CNID|nr:DNA damage responsive protein [Desmophyllum pertusum]